MGLVDNFLSTFGYHKFNNSDIQFFHWGGDSQHAPITFDFERSGDLARAYEECSSVSTIIGKLSSAMANGKWWLVDGADNDVKSQNRSVFQLFSNPNPLQTWTEFIIQAETYRLLYGEVFFIFGIPIGFSAKDATSICVISPRNIEIEYTGKMYLQHDINDIVKSYILNINGNRKEIDKSCILHVRDVYQNLNFSPYDIRGKSRLASLAYEVRNSVLANEAVYTLNKDRGAQGILTNKKTDDGGSVPLTKGEKDNLQRGWSSYGLKERQKKVIITDANLGWIPITYNVQELMLFDGIKLNKEQISDAFNFPFELLANSKGATFTNGDTATKRLYQDAVIPFSKIYSEKFTHFMGLDKENKQFIIDFSEVEYLKEAKKEEAEALRSHNAANQIAYQNGAITINEWRSSIGMDEIPDGDRYYIKQEGNE
ncbi:MAG: phage portal protein [Dysgonamonadaceae bacterium]|nr:phage portal protein [Dysgonamonadaceae bacterium]